MRAPTPVRSLVHSSTLVAAGVWFLLRYSYLFENLSVWLLYISSLLTVIISGVCACSFTDLKKIVAFSTCKKISWCLLFFFCGDFFLASCHLVTHGLCKCFLFMTVGDLMSSSYSGQKFIGVFPASYVDFWGCLVRSVLVFSLCGLPFLGVFFSKHCFISFLWGGCFRFSLFVEMLGVFLSYVYSFRFFLMLLGNSCGLGVGFSKDFVLLGGLIFLGTLVKWVLFGVLEEIVCVGKKERFLLILLQTLGLSVGSLIYVGGLKFGVAYRLFGCDSFVDCLYNFYEKLAWVIGFVFFRWEVLLLECFLGLEVFYLRKFYGFFVNMG